MEKFIEIKGARVNNLKNISLKIPRNKFIVVTGVSGSGKSSLAFDTLYAEGQRRYVESLSAYARQFLGRMRKPECDRSHHACTNNNAMMIKIAFQYGSMFLNMIFILLLLSVLSLSSLYFFFTISNFKSSSLAPTILIDDFRSLKNEND